MIAFFSASRDGEAAGRESARPHQVIQHAWIHLAGDDRGDDRVAGHGSGGFAVQPRPAITPATLGSGRVQRRARL